MKDDRPIVLLLAIGLDLVLGEPPWRWHPVAWMGRAIAAMQSRAPRSGPLAELVFGTGVAMGGALSSAAAGLLLRQLLAWLPLPLRWSAEAALLKSLLAVRCLADAGSDVERALRVGDLPAARRLAGWHLVSRDTSELDAAQVAAATIESVAENSSDSIVAPLFYYALGGLPAVMAYRFLNTCDAMLGYRDAAREWLGKVPARLDDIVNLLPARLTALLLVMAAYLTGEDGANAWRVWRQDAAETASPNAGHPMSAMAGALGVSLEKVGHYRLGSGQAAPTAADIVRAARLMYTVTALATGFFALFGLVQFLRRGHGR